MQSESGPQRVTQSDEEELQNVCKCFSAKTFNETCTKLTNYSRVIRDGNCLNTRSIRSYVMGDSSRFSTPPEFFENVICQGTNTIILSSSGEQRKLTLKQASVFICPGSIDSSLQELDVIGVPKILIAPRAFKSRDSDITIRFTNVLEKITIPEEAFSVDFMIPVSPSGSDQIELEGGFKSPPKVKFDVNTATEVEFRSRSIVAPIVKIKLVDIKTVLFNSKATIPYAHPEASTLEVSDCQSVTLGTQTINAGKFEAKYIKQLLMKEKAVEVVDDDGAGAKIEHVTNMTVLSEALSIGSGADIIFNNITLTSAGVRSIQGTGPGNLRRATFTHVRGKQLASVAMCIRTETAIVFNLEIGGKDGNHTGACIQGQEKHGNAEGGAVVCERFDISGNICDDPKCAPCSPSTKGIPATITTISPITTTTTSPITTIDSTTISLITTIGSTSLQLQHEDDLSNIQISLTASPLTSSTEFGTPQDVINVSFLSLSEDSKGDTSDHSESSIFQEIKDTPIYIIIIFLCVVIISILFATYMIYRCCNRNKHDKYHLPQQNRLSTFRNPRTIMTPENLTEQSDTLKRNDGDTQVYTTFDSYRQPAATYIVTPEAHDLNSPSCSTENQLPYQEEDFPSGHYPIALAESDANLPPPEYQQQDLPPRERNLSSAEDCYLYPEDEVPLDNTTNDDSTPLPDHLPPPDGYIHSNEQMTNEDLSSSEDESSLSGSITPPPDYQLYPDENQGVLPQGCPAPQAHQPVDNQVHAPNEMSVQMNRLSLLNREMSDEEIII